MRDSLEALIQKVVHNRESSVFNHLMSTADTIVSSSQYRNMGADSFLGRLLNLAFELSGEADFGSCLYYEDGFWTFSHAIGHPFEKLRDIHLPGELYQDRVNHWRGRKEVASNIFIVPSILESEASTRYSEMKEMLDKIVKVSQPLKETIQLHIYFDSVLKAVISLDIKQDSVKSFSNHTTNILRRIDFLGQIFFANASMVTKSISFERLTELITNLMDRHQDSKAEFMDNFLHLLVDSLYEAEYASAYVRDKNGIYFLATIGHDLKKLQSLKLKPEHFVSIDDIDKYKIPFVDREGKAKQVSATLFSDLFKYAKSNMPEDVYNAYIAASKPVKDGIISQARLNDDAYMYISCDIKEGSPLSFSKDSIQLFSALNNLGFSFISNQYYMDEFKALNMALENKVSERTLALEISNRKLKAIADKDSMTGLLNHKTIIERLEDMTETDDDLSIFLFDIDYFKNVNDTYGHQMGDEVLIGISELLMEDHQATVGRYGGEEFLILLPGFDHDMAKDYCQSILERIRTTRFIEEQTITVSGGLITRRMGNATELIQSADTLLYEAKNDGRDCLKAGYR